MDRFIPSYASPSQEFEVSEPGRVHSLATSVAGGLRSEAVLLSSAPSSAVSWTHGGISNNRLHTHLLQRELLGTAHVASPPPASALAAPGRPAADGLLLPREGDASHWSAGGPSDVVRAREAAAESAGAVPDPSMRPRATGLAAEARAAALLSTPPRHRVLHFGSPGSARRAAGRGSGADSSFEGDDAGTGGVAFPYDADENLGRRGGGGAGADWASVASPSSRSTSVASVGGGGGSTGGSSMSLSSAGSSSSSSTMSPLAMAAAAAAAIRGGGLTGLSAGSEELLRSPKHLRRKISRVPYKVLDAPLLTDDFYLNLLSWSSTNVLAVALARDVYTWEGRTAKVCVLWWGGLSRSSCSPHRVCARR